MNIEELKLIKAVHDGLQQGISNPLKINNAYDLLPNKMIGSPMRAKIMAINRFIMLSYQDVLKELQQVKPVEIPVIVESIGTIDNLPKQSHKESVNDDMAEMQTFLTAKEKQDLKSHLAGTVLEHHRQGRKRTTIKK